jgi:hypothetical protein
LRKRALAYADRSFDRNVAERLERGGGYDLGSGGRHGARL